MSKIKIEDIREELKENGWELLSTEYKNLDEQLTFKCPEGHTVYQSWKKLRSKMICPICEKNVYKTTAQETKVAVKRKGIQRVLAIDQATYTSGYSIFDGNELIRYGTYTTSYNDAIERANAVKVWLINMINNWHPDIIGIEGIQFQEKGGDGNERGRMGVTTFQTLAWLQGILMDTCLELDIPYEICPTNTWRKHCGVKGQKRHDKKRSMQLLAKKWYDVSVTEDEADAIGIGKFVADSRRVIHKITSWE